MGSLQKPEKPSTKANQSKIGPNTGCFERLSHELPSTIIIIIIIHLQVMWHLLSAIRPHFGFWNDGALNAVVQN